MQRMSAKYKDALLALDDEFLRSLKDNASTSSKIAERYRAIRSLFSTNGHKYFFHIPSLRERKQDLWLLVSIILQDSDINPFVNECRKAERISLDAITYLEERDYAGNFRKFKFCISQAVNNAFSGGCNCLCLRHFYMR